MKSVTRTGSFPIGFRRGWSAWQKDLKQFIDFAVSERFAAVDVGAMELPELKQILDAGLMIGSVDLKQPWKELASADEDKRKSAAEINAAYMRQVAALGISQFFAVALVEDESVPRAQSMTQAIDGYGRLCEQLAGCGARVVFEGWPGGAPRYPSLACTPADYRLLLAALPHAHAGINFDPSHLIRMGIDPIRFLREFGPRVGHVHAKDTQLLDDELFEHGNLQVATDAKPHGFGGHHWRYTIPGHGVARWDVMFRILQEQGYSGMVSIELEDENFNGSEEGEKRGLIASRDFLLHA